MGLSVIFTKVVVEWFEHHINRDGNVDKWWWTSLSVMFTEVGMEWV